MKYAIWTLSIFFIIAIGIVVALWKETKESSKKTCHATEDNMTHNACAMQESCETCKSYRKPKTK